MESLDLKTIDSAHKAASFYSKFALLFYDTFVFKCVAPLVFRCPEKEVVDFYLKNVSAAHLDVGVGTGYLLKKCLDAKRLNEVSLLDLNENCLEVTKAKLKPIEIATYKANILESLPFKNQKFKSIGLNFVLHCVPGSFKEKGKALVNLGQLLTDDGVIFGSTVIYSGAQNGIAQWLMNAHNKLGIFNNINDFKEDLHDLLNKAFNDVEIVQTGNIVFFKASQTKL